MENDLLLQHLNQYIARNYPPDSISREWALGEDSDEEFLVIRFEWFSGKSRDFGYSSERYEIVWRAFNQYWKSQEASS